MTSRVDNNKYIGMCKNNIGTWSVKRIKHSMSNFLFYKGLVMYRSLFLKNQTPCTCSCTSIPLVTSIHTVTCNYTVVVLTKVLETEVDERIKGRAMRYYLSHL